MGAPLIPIIAAIAARQQRDMLEAFESREAMSAATALPLGSLGLERNRMFRSFERDGVIRAAGADRFWLDRQALADWRTRVRKVGIGIVALVFAAAIIITAIVIIFAQRK